MTLSEAEFLRTRLEALEPVRNEDELMAWDDETSSSPHFLSVSGNDAAKLEEAYQRKLREITGWGAA